MKEVSEVIHCHGHPNVLGLHKSTFEITKESELSLSGDCIIGVGADKGLLDLSPEFIKLLSSPHSVLITNLSVEGHDVIIRSEGSSEMALNHPTDLVWRRSTFVCPRTVGIYSDHVACQIPREIIQELQKGKEMVVTLTVRQSDELR